MRGEDIHVGDVLVVKTMEEMIEDGGVVRDDGLSLPDSVFFNGKMKYLCGQTIVVDSYMDYDNYCFVYPEDGDLLYMDNPIGWCLSAEMLKPFVKEMSAFADNDLDKLLGF